MKVKELIEILKNVDPYIMQTTGYINPDLDVIIRFKGFEKITVHNYKKILETRKNDK